MSSNYLSNSFIYQSSKVPLSTKRSFSKPKHSLISIHHIHISSQNSPFCKKCGGIFLLSNSNASSITSLKPKYLNYSPEIAQQEILNQLKHQIQLQQLPEYYINNDIDINPLRKKMITRMRNFKDKFKMSRSSLYLGILLMDILIIKEKAFSFHKIEQIGIGAYIVAMKYIDLIIMITSIKQFQLRFENASVYSCDLIRKFEANVLKKLNYKLNYISFFHVIQLLLMNGIVFTSDIISDKSTSIYFLVHQICDIVLESGLYYLNYNPFLIACAIIALARHFSEQEKWPSIFYELYSINETHFQREYDFINEIYIRKTQMIKMTPKIKITRNAVYNTNNNLYKLKNKGFFNSNNCNVNMHNNQLLKQIFNNRKMFSKSMEMTHDLSTARNGSANQKSKRRLSNHSHAGLRKTCSKENSKESIHNKENRRLSGNVRQFIKIESVNKGNIRMCSARKDENKSSSVERYSQNIRRIDYHSNHIKSTCSSHSHSRAGNNHYRSNSNIYNFHMSSNVKENKKIHNNHSNNGKEHFSLNSSYCTATETVNGIGNNSVKMYNKKSNSSSNHKNIQDYKSKLTNSSKRIKNKKNGVHNIPNPINFSQSFHKKTNNEDQNINEITNSKINQDNMYSTNKKDIIKRKMDIIEEMTLNKLYLISNKVKRITKKQTSFSTQKLVKINGNTKGINERQRRRIGGIISAKKKINNQDE